MSTMNNNNNSSKSPRLIGAIPELGIAVFTLGEKNSYDKHDSVKRKIAYHVGRTLHSSMHDLIMFDTEKTFTKPTRPASKAVTRSDTVTGDKDDDADIIIEKVKVDPFDMKEYEKELSEYMQEKKEYREYKGKCFIVILGQCTTALTNKLEGDKTSYLALKKSNDVIGLLNKIKEYQASPSGKVYEIETLVSVLMRYLNINQQTNESFPVYRARLESTCDTAYAHVDLVPKKLPENVTEDQFKEALKAFLLLKGGSNDTFEDLKETFQTNHRTTSGTYPIEIDAMASLMNDHVMAKRKGFKAPTPTASRDSTPKSNNLSNNQVDEPAPSTEQLGPPRRSATPAPARPSRGAFQS